MDNRERIAVVPTPTEPKEKLIETKKQAEERMENVVREKLKTSKKQPEVSTDELLERLKSL